MPSPIRRIGPRQTDIRPADGIDVDLEPEPANRDVVEAEDGSGDVIVQLNPEDLEAASGEFQDIPHDANLAEYMDDSTLRAIGASICQAVKQDLESRREWEEGLILGIRYLGVKPNETRTKPFKGACGVFDSMMLKACVRFQATAFKELMPAAGPVKTQIIGASTMQNMPRATRTRTFMNYYLTTAAPEYRPEYRVMLWWDGLEGSVFKKVYFDEVLKRPVAPMVRAQDVIVPYGSTDLFTAPRITHRFILTDREIKGKQLSGEYLADVTLEEYDVTGTNLDQIKQAEDMAIGVRPVKVDIDKNYRLYETQAYLDLERFPHVDPDGTPTNLPLPYRITVDSTSQKVLAIRKNWDEKDPSYIRQNWFVHYSFVPGMGFYGLGFAHILGNTAMSATALRRQITDAATLATMPSGFRSSGARFADNNVSFQPLEFPEVNTGGQPIGNFIMPLPFKEPSPTSISLLQETYQQAENLSSSTEIAVGEGRQDAPVGTIMALLEAATRVESSVVSGCHDALRIELGMIAALFGQTLPPNEPYPFATPDGMQTVMRDDFAGHIDVVPVSDPNIASQTQRLVRAQFVQQAALQAPPAVGINVKTAYQLMFMEMGFDPQIMNALMPPQPQPQPMDPLSENQLALMQKPIVVAPWQDHAAHIAVHQALAQLPNVQAHLQEHMGQQMRMQVEQIIGHPLPPLGAPMPPQIQNQIAQMTAQAMAKLKAQAAATAPGGPADAQSDLANKALQVQMAEAMQKFNAAQVQSQTEIDKANIQSQDKSADRAAKIEVARIRATATEEAHGLQPDLGVGQ